MSNDGDNNQYILDLNDIDVLCGRGSGPNDRAGNIDFRNLVLTRKAEYLAATTRDAKGRIAAEIVANVRSRGGRFLKKLSPQQAKDAGFKRGVAVYELADEPSVLEKAKQTLRQNRAEFVAKVTKEHHHEGVNGNNPGGHVNGVHDNICRMHMGDALTPPIRGSGQSYGSGGGTSMGNHGYSQFSKIGNSAGGMSFNPLPLDSSNVQLDSMQHPIMSSSTVQQLNAALLSSSDLNYTRTEGTNSCGNSSGGINRSDNISGRSNISSYTPSANNNMNTLHQAAEMISSGASGGSLNTEAANAIYAALEANQSYSSSGKTNLSKLSTNSADAFEALIREYNMKEQQILMQQYQQLKSRQQDLTHLQHQFEQQPNIDDFQPQNVTSLGYDDGGISMKFVPEDQQAQFYQPSLQHQYDQQQQQQFEEQLQRQRFQQQQKQRYHQYRDTQQQEQSYSSESSNTTSSVFDSVVRQFDSTGQVSQQQEFSRNNAVDMPYMNKSENYHFPSKRFSDSSNGGFATIDEERMGFSNYDNGQQNELMQQYYALKSGQNSPRATGDTSKNSASPVDKYTSLQTSSDHNNSSEESLPLSYLQTIQFARKSKADQSNSILKSSAKMSGVEPANFKHETEESLRLSFVTANRLAATLSQDMSYGSVVGQNTTAPLKRQGANTNKRRSMQSFNNSEQSMMSMMSLSLSLSEISQDMFRSSTKLPLKPDAKNANEKDDKKIPHRPAEVIMENSTSQVPRFGESSMSLMNAMEESWTRFPPTNENDESDV